MSQQVTFKTTMGSITLELYTQHAPKTCENFIRLVQSGYYVDTIFHRVITGFMIQGGDPTGTGYGGASTWGGTFEDEQSSLTTLKHTGAGVLSMANSGPNTNGSQFFVTLAPTPWLDGKHVVFGRVSSGMRVIERIGQVAVDGEDRPLDEIKVLATKLVENDGLEDGEGF